MPDHVAASKSRVAGIWVPSECLRVTRASIYAVYMTYRICVKLQCNRTPPANPGEIRAHPGFAGGQRLDTRVMGEQTSVAIAGYRCQPRRRCRTVPREAMQPSNMRSGLEVGRGRIGYADRDAIADGHAGLEPSRLLLFSAPSSGRTFGQGFFERTRMSREIRTTAFVASERERFLNCLWNLV